MGFKFKAKGFKLSSKTLIGVAKKVGLPTTIAGVVKRAAPLAAAAATGGGSPMLGAALSFAAKRGIVKAGLSAGAKLGQLGARRPAGMAAPSGGVLSSIGSYIKGAAGSGKVGGFFGGGRRRRRKRFSYRDIEGLMMAKMLLGSSSPGYKLLTFRKSKLF